MFKLSFFNDGILALDRAEKLNIPVTLLVLKGAAAKRLYDRLGFYVTDEYENNYKMRWQPKSISD